MLCSLVLLNDLLLLYWGGVVVNAEELVDFLDGLAHDHAGDFRTGQFELGLFFR